MKLTSDKPRIVIVGGGFGGLYAAKNLGTTDASVTLIDRRNFHLFQPLLYQVATGGLSPGDIASPIRGVLKNMEHVVVVQETVEKFDLQAKAVITDQGVHAFDYLIVAAGAGNFYFGNSQWEKQAPGLKSVEDALVMRRKILRAFEAAESETDPQIRKSLLTFVIIGAGPTGVELAGALAELARFTLKKEFRNIDPAEARVIVVEGGDNILNSYPLALTKKARKTLENMGVEVRTGAMVTDIADDHVTLKSGDEVITVETRTVLWAAGVKPSPLAKMLAEQASAETDRGGRIVVLPDMSMPAYPNVFIVGDMAHCKGKNGKPLPGIAPVAMQQGRYVAELLKRQLRGKSYPAFQYRDKGSLAVIGRNAAIARVAGMNMSGWIAWVVWVFVHIAYLIGFDNKLLVLFQWFTNYVTRKRGARLITEGFGKGDRDESI